MFSIILSIIALGVIVMIHELGHFIAARACGVGVIEFSVGMGPRILTKAGEQTRYSLRALPFGGSCMLLGEETEEAFAEGPDIIIDGRHYDRSGQFVSKKAWQRFIVIFAGPAFNFILAFLLSLIVTGMYGLDRPVVTEVTAGMPVAEAGIEAGDLIVGLKTGGTKMTVECSRDISIFMTVHRAEIDRGDEFTVYYLDSSDGNTKKQAVITPVYDPENQVRRFGFSYSMGYRKADGPAEVLLWSTYNVKNCIRSVIESLRMLVRGSVSREDVMGPVRMVALMDETVDGASDYGTVAVLVTLIDIMIVLSGSIGCMNLLPLPALDGGRLVFILIEMITGRAVPKRIEARVHMLGMLLLLTMMFFVLANDVTLLISGK